MANKKLFGVHVPNNYFLIFEDEALMNEYITRYNHRTRSLDKFNLESIKPAQHQLVSVTDKATMEAVLPDQPKYIRCSMYSMEKDNISMKMAALAINRYDISLGDEEYTFGIHVNDIEGIYFSIPTDSIPPGTMYDDIAAYVARIGRQIVQELSNLGIHPKSVITFTPEEVKAHQFEKDKWSGLIYTRDISDLVSKILADNPFMTLSEG